MFSARYGLSPCTKQIRFVFKWLNATKAILLDSLIFAQVFKEISTFMDANLLYYKTLNASVILFPLDW